LQGDEEETWRSGIKKNTALLMFYGNLAKKWLGEKKEQEKCSYYRLHSVF